MEQINICY